MSFDAHKNFAITTIANPPTPPTSGVSLTVLDATVFPTTPFNAVIWPIGQTPTKGNAEIVRVTTIVSNTLTISRTQEGSVARNITAGDQIGANITVKTVTDLETEILSVESIVTSLSSTVSAIPAVEDATRIIAQQVFS